MGFKVLSVVNNEQYLNKIVEQTMKLQSLKLSFEWEQTKLLLEKVTKISKITKCLNKQHCENKL